MRKKIPLFIILFCGTFAASLYASFYSYNWYDKPMEANWSVSERFYNLSMIGFYQCHTTVGEHETIIENDGGGTYYHWKDWSEAGT